MSVIKEQLMECFNKCPICNDTLNEDAGINKEGVFVTVESCYSCDYRKEEQVYKN